MDMTNDAWARPHFIRGGGHPFLYYVVFGEFDSSVALSRSRYRVKQIPPELEMTHHHESKGRETLEFFREGPIWEMLLRSDPSLARQISGQKSCVVLRGEFGDCDDLGYLRDSIGVVTHLADQEAVSVYDPQILRWWRPEEWRESIFEPAAPCPGRHAVILSSESENGTEWLHTRGMRKFGRPDISVDGVTPDWRDGAIELCRRFIDFQALGGVIEEGKEVRMTSVPEGLTCHHRGSLEDPDFNNYHVSICNPSTSG
jgi:hypothetical protein